MVLPTSRNTTYAALSQVKSADLNDIQDKIIDSHNGILRLNALMAAPVRVALSSWPATETLGASVQDMVYDDVNYTWVAVSLGSGTSYCETTSDGATWTSRTIPSLGYSPSSVYLAAGGGVILATWDPTSSTATRLMRSTDGGWSWATQDLPVSYDGDTIVVWTGSNFLAIQDDLAVYKSATGATGSWSAVTSIPAGYSESNFKSTAIFNGTLAGTGDQMGDEKYISTSDEGATWDTGSLSGSDPRAGGIAYSPTLNKWVIVGGQNLGAIESVWFADAPDGTWTLQGSVVIKTRSGTNDLDELVEIGGVLVAMSGIDMVTSLDGLTWTGGLKVHATDTLRAGGGRVMHHTSTSFHISPAV